MLRDHNYRYQGRSLGSLMVKGEVRHVHYVLFLWCLCTVVGGESGNNSLLRPPTRCSKEHLSCAAGFRAWHV